MDIDAENTTNNGYRKEKRVKEVEGDVVGEYETKRLTELEWEGMSKKETKRESERETGWPRERERDREIERGREIDREGGSQEKQRERKTDQQGLKAINND